MQQKSGQLDKSHAALGALYEDLLGISFVDSTPIRVCKNKRINANKVFKDIANVGRSTMGWFYGFKLHIVINDKGELLDFVITQANEDDRASLKEGKVLKKIFGSLYATRDISRKNSWKCSSTKACTWSPASGTI